MKCSICDLAFPNMSDLEKHFLKRHWKDLMALKKRSKKEAREKHGEEHSGEGGRDVG